MNFTKMNSDYGLSYETMERINSKILSVCAEFGFHCVQVNGQRICTSTETSEEMISKGTEIFIGKIPKDIFEDELIPLLVQAGNLFRLRLMLDFSYKNRGFAFATYTSVSEAEKAILLFDKYLIRPKHTLGVFKSVDNCRLFFGNIPQSFTKADVLRVLNENLIEGVKEVIMYQDLLNPSLNRGYVFVEFGAHRDAAMARKQLYPGCLIVEGQAVFVDWADPIPDVDSKVMAKVTKLFIHHLPVELKKAELTRFIGKLVDSSRLIKVHKQMDYAFVHFEDRISAETAKEALQDLPFPGVVIEWARPREYSKQLRLESPPTHFCLSLPPKMRRHYQQYINTFISESACTGSSSSRKRDNDCMNMDSTTSYSKIFPSYRNKDKALAPAAHSTPVLKTERKTENDCMNMDLSTSYSKIFPPYRNEDKALAPAAHSTPVLKTEENYRNPLFGLPVSLVPFRVLENSNSETQMTIEEGSNHEMSWDADLHRNVYENASLFSSCESLSTVQSRIKPLFEFF